MSILPQTPTAPAGLTVRELVSYGRFPRRHGLGKEKKEDEDKISWAMEVTRLTGLETAAVDALSGGSGKECGLPCSCPGDRLDFT